MTYKVIKDTREKVGSWDFDNQEIRVLRTGDYSMEGYEHLISLERKKTITELAGNLVQTRFYNELRRMDDIKHNFLILEFSMYDLLYYPQTSNLSFVKKQKIQLTGPVLLRKLNELMLEYNVQVLFCDNRDNAVQVASSIFKRIYERYEIT